jgi:glycosyltransferase involved in cell wall biosynthesis
MRSVSRSAGGGLSSAIVEAVRPFTNRIASASVVIRDGEIESSRDSWRPKYSIVCAAYNVEQYVDETIASVLAQTETDWELIIVDDGSSDGTVDRIRRYNDSRIELIEQSNGGPAAARNTGIAASRGARLLVLDSDDCLHPAALTRLGAALDASKAVASYGQCRIITDDGQLIGPLYRPRRNYPPAGDLLAYLLTRNLFVNGGHVCMVGDVARSLGGFRTDLPVGEDHEYWCRLAARGSIVYTGSEQPVLDYRRRPGSWYKQKSRVPEFHARFIEAAFGNQELVDRLSLRERRRLRRAAEANAYWIVAREHIRFGDWSTARGFLVKSLLKKANYLRAAVLAFAFCGGAPESIQQRFMAIRRYEFLR